jgi:hypothetical protein
MKIAISEQADFVICQVKEVNQHPFHGHFSTVKCSSVHDGAVGAIAEDRGRDVDFADW